MADKLNPRSRTLGSLAALLLTSLAACPAGDCRTFPQAMPAVTSESWDPVRAPERYFNKFKTTVLMRWRYRQ